MNDTYDESSLPDADPEFYDRTHGTMQDDIVDGVLMMTDEAELTRTSSARGVLNLGIVFDSERDVHTACWRDRRYRCLDPQRLTAGTVYALVLFDDGFCTLVVSPCAYHIWPSGCFPAVCQISSADLRRWGPRARQHPPRPSNFARSPEGEAQ